MSNIVTICFQSYNQPQMLEHWWKMIADWPEEKKTRIDVNYCDDHSSPPAVVPKEVKEMVRVFRHSRTKKDIAWNQFGCANWNTYIAEKGSLVWLTDTDAIPVPDGIRHALKIADKAANLVYLKPYLFSPKWPEQFDGKGCNFHFLRREMLLDVGGYDQRFSGHYGYGDDLFYRNMIEVHRMPRRHDKQLRILHHNFDVAPDCAAGFVVKNLSRDLGPNRTLYKTTMRMGVRARVREAKSAFDMSLFERVDG